MANPEPLPDDVTLADRLGARALNLAVVEAARLTPSMQRVVLTADDLADLGNEPGHDFMLSIPFAGGGLIRRRYSIRAFDPSARTVTLDFVLHGDGPGATWADHAQPGDRVDAIGPRGKVLLDPDADWHLFVGDDSFAPASLAMAEATTAPRIVVLEIDGPGHEPPHAVDGADATVRWVHRGGAAPDDPSRLLAALDDVQLPEGRGHAYVGSEMGVMRALVGALRERGLPEDAISAKPYWRSGRANAPHGEPDRG